MPMVRVFISVFLSARKQVRDMQVKDIQRLIDNKLQPNVAE